MLDVGYFQAPSFGLHFPSIFELHPSGSIFVIYGALFLNHFGPGWRRAILKIFSNETCSKETASHRVLCIGLYTNLGEPIVLDTWGSLLKDFYTRFIKLDINNVFELQIMFSRNYVDVITIEPHMVTSSSKTGKKILNRIFHHIMLGVSGS